MAIEEVITLITEFGWAVADYEHRVPDGEAYLKVTGARQRLEDAIKQYKEQK